MRKQQTSNFLLSMTFIGGIFLSLSAGAIEDWVPATLESSSFNFCHVDVDLQCTPPTKKPVGMTGSVWAPHTPAQRLALYKSKEVQTDQKSCEKFALLIKTECKIETSVVTVFYDSKMQLKETSIVFDFNTDLDNQNTPGAFNNYFTNASVVSCPEFVTLGDSPTCASSITNPIWLVNNKADSTVTGQELISGNNLMVKTYELEAKRGNKSAKARIKVLPFPTSNIKCHLANQGLGFSCDETLADANHIPIQDSDWYKDGVSYPSCHNLDVCHVSSRPNGSYFMQKISRSVTNLLVKSNVEVVVITNNSGSGHLSANNISDLFLDCDKTGSGTQHLDSGICVKNGFHVKPNSNKVVESDYIPCLPNKGGSSAASADAKVTHAMPKPSSSQNNIGFQNNFFALQANQNAASAKPNSYLAADVYLWDHISKQYNKNACVPIKCWDPAKLYVDTKGKFSCRFEVNYAGLKWFNPVFKVPDGTHEIVITGAGSWLPQVFSVSSTLGDVGKLDSNYKTFIYDANSKQKMPETFKHSFMGFVKISPQGVPDPSVLYPPKPSTQPQGTYPQPNVYDHFYSSGLNGG